MKATVVFLFDSLRARAEALGYAVELAARMDSALVLLMLLGLDEAGRDRAESLEASVATALEPHLEKAQRAGVAVEPVLRIGDPYSELMKYLAETRTIATIVWGGDEAAVRHRPRRETPHWLVRMRDTIDLPVVVPSLRS